MPVRGCGESRDQNGLYLCVGSPYGRPISYFLVDPPLRWKGGQLRAPMLIGDSEGVNHVALGIGKRFYPFVPDFVEEAGRLGISKKVPRNFDPSALTPDKSKLLLIHPRAIPEFPYKLDRLLCPKGIAGHMKASRLHLCIGDLWPLSSVKSVKGVHEVTRRRRVVKVSTPSCTYTTRKPQDAPPANKTKYSSGIILAFQRFFFQYINPQRRVPSELKERMQKAKFRLEVVPE